MFVRLVLAVLVALPIAYGAAVDQNVVSVSKLASKVQVTDCGSASDAVLVKEIVVSPDPPKPGDDVTITATGVVQQRLEAGAYADVTVKMGLIKLLKKRFDVCEEAQNANASVQCPVDPDTYTIVQTVTLPKEVPPGKFVINVRGFTGLDDPMICLDLKLDFLPGKPKFLDW